MVNNDPRIKRLENTVIELSRQNTQLTNHIDRLVTIVENMMSTQNTLADRVLENRKRIIEADKEMVVKSEQMSKIVDVISDIQKKL